MNGAQLSVAIAGDDEDQAPLEAIMRQLSLALFMDAALDLGNAKRMRVDAA